MKSQNLKIENVKTSDLIPYIGNAKLHPEKQILQIASSIKEFGFVVPVLLDEDNGIIAGHGRVEAAKKLKMKTVPCVRIGDLTPAQVRGLRIAENQLTMSSGWDYETLGLELDGLKELDFDLDVLGFEDLDFMGYVDDIDFPDLPDGDKQPFQQMTFTLHDTQAEQVEDALRISKGMGPFDSENENSNGNALARICETFITDNGQS